MDTSERTKLATRMNQLEALWRNFDELFAGFDAADWARRHGPDWTFADVPYHMAFFDQCLVADAIARGSSASGEGRLIMQTFRDMAVWNAQQFARRPADQTPAQSIAQYRASQQAIRRAVSRLSDADLEQRVWLALVSARGWRTVDFVLWVCLAHTWNEFMQLRLYAERDAPVPDPAITHSALDALTRIQQIFLSREQATHTSFTLVWEYTGPGGGAWTVHIANGACSYSEGRPQSADLILTQSVETFVRVFNDMLTQEAAIQSGALKVNPPEKLAIFQRLYPPPKGDQIIEPWGE